MMLAGRQVWWSTMRKDIDEWVEKCFTCLRFRRIAVKQESPAAIPLDAECWEEVMIDLEGPNAPADRDGNRYSMTYVCCLCHGTLLDRAPRANATEARRMFATCMLRSGTIPTMCRSDRGPELKNAIMTEYMSLIGIGRRFGTPWRPMEQGLVEGKHVQTQRILGMLVKDVMKCFPTEVGELYHVVEFVIYNTPGAHGFTPRDIDRRWSVSAPLERELQPFQVGEFEPVQDYVSNLYKAYREIRVRVLKYLKQSAEKRAELANRWRKHKDITPGTKVVLQDPRHRQAGGRTPYKKPFIRSLRGHRSTWEQNDCSPPRRDLS